MIVPLKLRNYFNYNNDNNDKNDNKNGVENDNANSHSFHPRVDLDDLIDKTDLSKNRKSKQFLATNVNIICRLNDKNFK